MQKQLLTARQFVYTSYVETKSEGRYVMNMTEYQNFLVSQGFHEKKHLLFQKKTSQKLHFQKIYNV